MTRTHPRNPRLFCALVALLTATLLNVVGAPPAKAAIGAVVPLTTYENPTTGDRWTGTSAPTASGYTVRRLEGRIFSPSGDRPPGTKPLYTWYSESAGDSVTTTAGAWTPSGPTDTTRPGGFSFVRLEGFVHDAPRLGTLPLRLWWSPSVADNWTTADPLADGVPSNPPGYSQPSTTPQGYVVAPAQSVSLAQFGWATMRQNGFLAQGNRPLLVMAVDYDDTPLQRTFAEIEAQVFGSGTYTIQKFFQENSHGRFNWTNGGVIHVRYPGNFSATNGVDARPVAIAKAATQGYNWKQWDTDNDNIVEEQELGVVYYGAHPDQPTGGQTSGGAYDVDVGNGLRVRTRVSGFYDTSPTAVGIHEITHMLGATDLYGADFTMSAGLTMMGASGSEADWSTHLDPWHKMRLGWLEPSTFLVGQPTAACHELLNAAGSAPNAVLVYDPVNGPLDYLLVEYRKPQSYDKYVPDALGGLAVWHVQTHPNFEPKIVRSSNGLGLDATVWNVGSPPDTGNPGLRGQSTLWRDVTGHVSKTMHEFEIREFLDDSGVRFRPGAIGSGAQATMSLRLRHQKLTTEFMNARVDSVGGTGRVRTIRGDLGMRVLNTQTVNGTPTDTVRKVYVRRGTQEVAVNVSVWRCGEVKINIPSAATAGNWELIFKDGPTQVSNAWPITF